MKERIRPSADWYRRKVFSKEEGNFLIGPPWNISEATEANRAPAIAFGSLLRLERRNQHLTVSALAKALDVDEDEIRNIEHDPHYKARPRTILGIANHFSLPPREILKLAGAAASNDSRLNEKAMLFAAHSDDMGGLNKDEKQLLNAFVQFLKDNA
jgi:transcriptional regulator with XRE-family HTH domain